MIKSYSFWRFGKCFQNQVCSYGNFLNKMYFGSSCNTKECDHAYVTWKLIPNFSSYEVSNHGDVRSLKSKKILAQDKRTHSMAICLKNDNGKTSSFSVSRLVLSTFNPHPDAENLCASHQDGNFCNNHVDNLKWRSTGTICALRNQRHGCNWSQSVILTKYNDQQLIETTTCISITECIRCINEFFSESITECRPNQKSVFIDPCRTSSKTCTVEYIDKSRYQKTVAPIDCDEQWKFFHEGSKCQQYLVSNYGRVKIVYKNGTERLKKNCNVNGYEHVTFTVNKKCNTYRVHRLVATLFVENPNNFACIDHIDTNRSNNYATNLKWVKDMAENLRNPISVAKKIVNVRVRQYDTESNQFIQEWSNAHCVSKTLGFPSSRILSCCRGKIKTACGYRWRFVE